MLDAYIVEKIKKDREETRQPLQLPLPPPPEPKEKPQEKEPPRVIQIDLLGED